MQDLETPAIRPYIHVVIDGYSRNGIHRKHLRPTKNILDGDQIPVKLHADYRELY